MKLSIIIKVEFYREELEDCIKNIIENNSNNIEIIMLINEEDVLIKNTYKIIEKYYKKIDIYHIEINFEQVNSALNVAINNSNADYIHLINQNLVISKNFYSNFFYEIDEFFYDMFIFDYININKEINYFNIEKLINTKVLKNNINTSKTNEAYIEILNENDLKIDFSFLKNRSFKSKRIKSKKIKYISSNVEEKIQILHEKYKEELLFNANIKSFNIIIKRDKFLEDTFNFNNKLNTNNDLYKILPLIESIAYLKKSYIFNFKNIKKRSKTDKEAINEDQNTNVKTNIIIDKTKLNKLIKESKDVYLNTINAYKDNKVLYPFIELLEFNLFYDLLVLNSIKLDNEENKEEYKIQIYSFLNNTLPDFKYNRLFIAKNEKSKLLKKSIKKINQDIKNEVKSKTKTNEKTRSKTNRFNKFKVLTRKIKFDLNKIKRTRINKNIIKLIKKTRNKILNFIKTVNKCFKDLYNKIFKRDKKENLLIEKKEQLLLKAPEEIKKDSELEIKTINKIERLEANQSKGQKWIH